MNPLMQAMGNSPTPSSNMTQLGNIIRMLRSGNPQQIAQNLMMQNPQFKEFIEANKGKDPAQVAREHGIDLDSIIKQM